VTFAPAGDEVPRVAYSVGRRIGGAVVRNRLRRRLRAAVADIPGLVPGAYLVGVSPGATALAYEDLKAQVTRAMTAASRPRPR
jgi:ribonuclease P protein component